MFGAFFGKTRFPDFFYIEKRQELVKRISKRLIGKKAPKSILAINFVVMLFLWIAPLTSNLTYASHLPDDPTPIVTASREVNLGEMTICQNNGSIQCSYGFQVNSPPGTTDTRHVYTETSKIRVAIVSGGGASNTITVFIDGQQIGSGTVCGGGVFGCSIDVGKYPIVVDLGTFSVTPNTIHDISIIASIPDCCPITSQASSAISIRPPTPPPDGDLSVTSASPVQAPDNPGFVIDGKPTIVKAKIKNTFTQSLIADVKVTSGSYISTATGITITPGENDYYIDPPTYITPTGPAGSKFTATIEVIPSSTITESNKENNKFTIDPSVTPIPIKKANQLNVIFVPLHTSTDTQPAPTCINQGSSEVTNYGSDAIEFLKAIYPLAPSDVLSKRDCTFPEVKSPPFSPPRPPEEEDDAIVSNVFKELEKASWCTNPQRCQDTGGQPVYVVGVARKGWFDEFTSFSSTIGLSMEKADPQSRITGGFKTAIAELPDGNTPAHEIGHLLGLDDSVTNIPSPGYYVTGHEPTQDPDLMGLDTGSGPFGEWISKQNFNFLKDKLAINPSDPAVIGISGLIAKDGTTLFDKLERFEDILDISADNTGQYTAVYMDVSDNVLDQIGFNVIFETTAHTSDPSISIAPFALRIPDVAGTEKIVIKKGDQVLAESTFESGGTTNHPPIATDDAATTDQGTAATIDVLANDNDEDNDPLTIQSVTSPTTKDGTAAIENGKIKYTPSSAFSGTDTFDYTVSDAKGGIDTATVTVTVNSGNNLPVASDVSQTTDQDKPVSITLKATDQDGNSLTYSIVSNPDNGQLSDLDKSAGTVTYTPKDGFIGTDSFTFKANDGKADSNTAKVTVTVKDTTPPDTKIDLAKDGDGNTISDGGTTQSDSITFTFSSPDSEVDKYQCSIDGSGLQDCSSPKSYSSLDKGKQHTFSVVSTDKDGNTDQSPAKFSWNIEAAEKWTIKGFYQPVDMNDVVNTVKSGQTVPLKFEVFVGDNEKTDTAVVDSFKQQKISCSSVADEQTDAIEITTTGGTALRYDTDLAQFIQNWKTPTKSANTCWKVTLTTDDGSSIFAYFKLT